MSMAPAPKRGDVWLVHFDPTIGAEIRKVRPAVVISVAGVGRLPLRNVVPLTDWKPHYAQASWLAAVPAAAANGLSKDSGADAFQVKSVSERRFVRRLGGGDAAANRRHRRRGRPVRGCAVIGQGWMSETGRNGDIQGSLRSKPECPFSPDAGHSQDGGEGGAADGGEVMPAAWWGRRG